MITTSIQKILAITFSVLWLVSCAPQPQMDQIPEIELSAEVEMNGCRLEASLKEGLEGEYDAGFYYGSSEEEMIKVSAQWESSALFTASLTSLEYDTEYLYKAYICNGYNEICSDVGHFRTKVLERTMILPFHIKEVGRLSSRFTFEVGGNADFSVTVPDEVDWLRCGTDGRKCIVFVETNDTEDTRDCGIVFKNLSDNLCDTLTVCQQAADASETNLPYNDVVLPPVEVHTWMTLVMDPDISVTPLDGTSAETDWLSCGSVTNIPYGYSEVFFRAEENTAYEDRSARFIVSYDGYDSVITVTQKACDAVIEFEDPYVEIVLVDAFDLDGDGKLSYAEAAPLSIVDAEKIDFSGLDIRAFEELRFFQEFWFLQAPSFAGSDIEYISFPYKLSGLGDGLFEYCTELEEIELNCISVWNHTFRGCTGLKNIRAEVSGANAFEGCTALETVEQQFAGVADQAFLNCTSLKSFEFRIKLMTESRIGYEAFRGCRSLPEISIPDVVKTIDDRAFYDCSSLESVFMEGFDPPVLGEDVFAGTSPGLKIYVRPESLPKYQAEWPLMADKIIAIECEGDGADSMILPFHYISLDSWETEFTIEVGGDAEFEVEIVTLSSGPQACRRDGRKCIFTFPENNIYSEFRWAAVFRNLSNGQREVLSICQYGPS